MNVVTNVVLVFCPIALLVGLAYWRRGGRALACLALMLGAFPAEYRMRPVAGDGVRLSVFAAFFLRGLGPDVHR